MKHNSSIERTISLNTEQQALLLHHIRVGRQADRGMLQSTFSLRGKLDHDLFERSWEVVYGRHPALRSSVYWQDVAQPVQVIHRRVHPDIEWKDYREYSVGERELQWDEYCSRDRMRGILPDRVPVGRLGIARFDLREYRVVWSTHHLIMDGWSGGVVLRDVLLAYESMRRGQSIPFPPLPRSVMAIRAAQFRAEPAGHTYWAGQLAQLSDTRSRIRTSDAMPGKITTPLESDLLATLQTAAPRAGVSLVSYLEAAGAKAISRLVKERTICFGRLDSGRTEGGVDYLDQAVGVYSTLLPIVVPVNPAEGITVTQMQRITTQAGRYRSQAPKGVHYDAVILVHNHLAKSLGDSTIVIGDIQSNLTSRSPITISIVPKMNPRVELFYDPHTVGLTVAQWLLRTYCRELGRLAGTGGGLSSEWQPAPVLPRYSPKIGKEGSVHSPPTNSTHLKLLRLWEDILPEVTIGIGDNFFELGGTSAQAVRLFSLIESEFSTSLPPSLLVTNGTIRQLASHLEQTDGTGTIEWPNVVTFRAGGQGLPLFCLHAGSGHIFFYRELVAHLGTGYPVYALQPDGLNGDSPMEKSVESMAKNYLDQIAELHDRGKRIALLTNCFSSALGVEMGRQLWAEGHPMPMLIVTDNAPQPDEVGNTSSFRFRRPLKSWVELPRHLRRTLSDLADRMELPFVRQWYARVRLHSLSAAERDEHIRYQRIVRHTYRLYERYTWPTYPGKIFLLQSADFAVRPDKNHAVYVWQNLARGGLVVLPVDGNHRMLFRDPVVRQVADLIHRTLTAAPVVGRNTISPT